MVIVLIIVVIVVLWYIFRNSYGVIEIKSDGTVIKASNREKVNIKAIKIFNIAQNATKDSNIIYPHIGESSITRNAKAVNKTNEYQVYLQQDEQYRDAELSIFYTTLLLGYYEESHSSSSDDKLLIEHLSLQFFNKLPIIPKVFETNLHFANYLINRYKYYSSELIKFRDPNYLLIGVYKAIYVNPLATTDIEDDSQSFAFFEFTMLLNDIGPSIKSNFYSSQI